jgi:hypothetical protein
MRQCVGALGLPGGSATERPNVDLHSSDCTCLVERKSAVLEGRNTPERMPRQIVGRRTFLYKDIKWHRLIFNPFLDEAKSDDSYVNAVICAEDAWLCGHLPPAVSVVSYTMAFQKQIACDCCS